MAARGVAETAEPVCDDGAMFRRRKKAERGAFVPTSIVVTYAEIVGAVGDDVSRVAIDDLRAVVVDDDGGWVVTHADGAWRVPRDADGADELFGRLRRLDGFDLDAEPSWSAS